MRNQPRDNQRPVQLDATGRGLTVGDTVAFNSDRARERARVVEVFGNGGLRLDVLDTNDAVVRQVVRGAYQVTRLPVIYDLAQSRAALAAGAAPLPLKD